MFDNRLELLAEIDELRIKKRQLTVRRMEVNKSLSDNTTPIEHFYMKKLDHSLSLVIDNFDIQLTDKHNAFLKLSF